MAETLTSLPKEISKPLENAIKNLIIELQDCKRLEEYQISLAKKKMYDQYERKYIQAQKLRKQLGNDYESSDSEDAQQINYENMNPRRFKLKMRNVLISKHFDEKVLTEVSEQSSEDQNPHDTPTKIAFEDHNSTLNFTITGHDQKSEHELKIIHEKEDENEQKHLQGQKCTYAEQSKQINFPELYALRFIIKQLQILSRKSK